MSEPVPKKSTKIPSIIKYIVKWRNEVFKKNPTMKDILEEEVTGSFADTCRSSKVSCSELLKDAIFQLSDLVSQNKQYIAVINSHWNEVWCILSKSLIYMRFIHFAGSLLINILMLIVFLQLSVVDEYYDISIVNGWRYGLCIAKRPTSASLML